MLKLDTFTTKSFWALHFIFTNLRVFVLLMSLTCFPSLMRCSPSVNQGRTWNCEILVTQKRRLQTLKLFVLKPFRLVWLHSLLQWIMQRFLELRTHLKQTKMTLKHKAMTQSNERDEMLHKHATDWIELRTNKLEASLKTTAWLTIEESVTNMLLPEKPSEYRTPETRLSRSMSILMATAFLVAKM